MTIGLMLTGAILLGVVLWFLLGRRARDNAWQDFAAGVGAQFVPGGLFGSSKVLVPVGSTTVTLDSYSVSTGDDSTISYTRIRAPFHRPDNFQFTLYRRGLLSGTLDRLLGARDIRMGDDDFDRRFLVQATDDRKVRRLFGDQDLRRLIQGQPSLRLMLRPSELHLSVKGIVRDASRLHSMFDLFGVLLQRLSE
jgi:hypothetical protein